MKHKTVLISVLQNADSSLSSSTLIMSKIFAPKGSFWFTRMFNADGLASIQAYLSWHFSAHGRQWLQNLASALLLLLAKVLPNSCGKQMGWKGLITYYRPSSESI